MFTSHQPLRIKSRPPVAAPSRPPLSFMSSRRAEGDGSIRLLLAGELDLAAQAHFESALEAAQHDAELVFLDLGALTLIDCAGLASIFRAAGRAARENAFLVLLDPRGQVRRVLDLVGIPDGVGVIDGEPRVAVTA